jgi:hypothetical protein
MGDVHLPKIPDVPFMKDRALYDFLRAVKETLEVMTGQVGGNTNLIDLMRED